jgi:hypothetical protein
MLFASLIAVGTTDLTDYSHYIYVNYSVWSVQNKYILLVDAPTIRV